MAFWYRTSVGQMNRVEILPSVSLALPVSEQSRRMPSRSATLEEIVALEQNRNCGRCKVRSVMYRCNGKRVALPNQYNSSILCLLESRYLIGVGSTGHKTSNVSFRKHPLFSTLYKGFKTYFDIIILPSHRDRRFSKRALAHKLGPSGVVWGISM
ncbi:hypothetical protein RF11_12159 [Thelohanellus kitauei]|uniref:Uncharacterized protein n=1 Tax=Thelohanellus kitauei TaxID=669202 RepID=A0A0C2MEY7_THEKT|nr:hypothetical protein RF11_12159 [Thelohanellus kitauei]